jgi:hypothetical protein
MVLSEIGLEKRPTEHWIYHLRSDRLIQRIVPGVMGPQRKRDSDLTQSLPVLC